MNNIDFEHPTNRLTSLSAHFNIDKAMNPPGCTQLKLPYASKHRQHRHLVWLVPPVLPLLQDLPRVPWQFSVGAAAATGAWCIRCRGIDIELHATPLVILGDTVDVHHTEEKQNTSKGSPKWPQVSNGIFKAPATPHAVASPPPGVIKCYEAARYDSDSHDED